MSLFDFLSKRFSTADEKFYVAKEDTIILDDATILTELKIDSNNFDVVIKNSLNETLSYSLSLKKGYELGDLNFSIRIESPTIIINAKTQKANMSGCIEISVPNNIEKYWIFSINGDINLHNAPISFLESETVNGDINLHLIDAEYSFKAKTTNGDINNRIRNEAESENKIICKTVNGDINIDKIK